MPHGAQEVGLFWWKDLLRLSVLYRGIAKCKIGDGSTVLFWDDLWSSAILSSKYECLHSFARNQRISVKADDLASLFNLPLSDQAYMKLQSLQIELTVIPYDAKQDDAWAFIWGSNKHLAAKFYTLTFNNVQVPSTFVWLWQSKCIPRIKFFGWLLIVDRLNTRNMLKRRNFHIETGYSCVMCSEGIEEDGMRLCISLLGLFGYDVAE